MLQDEVYAFKSELIKKRSLALSQCCVGSLTLERERERARERKR